MLDLLTLLVLAFIGVRLAQAARLSLGSRGRQRIAGIVHGLRLRHFLPAPVALVAVGLSAALLLSVPGLDFGWWSAIGGVGNPVTGGSERTTGTVLEWAVPLVFVTLLLPALPLFAEAEERMFRLGAEGWSPLKRVWRGVWFGLAHAVIGIPIGVALALSVGGWYFTWSYLRGFRSSGTQTGAVAESTRAHLAYNLTVVVIVIAATVAGGA